MYVLSNSMALVGVMVVLWAGDEARKPSDKLEEVIAASLAGDTNKSTFEPKTTGNLQPVRHKCAYGM